VEQENDRNVVMEAAQPPPEHKDPPPVTQNAGISKEAEDDSDGNGESSSQSQKIFVGLSLHLTWNVIIRFALAKWQFHKPYVQVQIQNG